VNVVAIIQARLASTRFPGKILEEVAERPMLEMLISRVKLSQKIDKIVVATTSESTDDRLCRWLNQENIDYFRGSEEDVLDRFWQCAKSYNADIVVRLTADDPLKDPKIIDEAVDLFLNNPDVDYVSNTIRPSYPEGLDVEVFSLFSLALANEKAKLKSEREHVTPYIWKTTETFKLLNFEMSRDLSAWRWTVDKPVDLEFIKTLLKMARNNIFASYLDLIAIIDKNPALMDINIGILRNEGYLKSINKEMKDEQ
jgi:spore coat polysaccharide biosynthesis protein SpsF